MKISEIVGCVGCDWIMPKNLMYIELCLWRHFWYYLVICKLNPFSSIFHQACVFFILSVYSMRIFNLFSIFCIIKFSTLSLSLTLFLFIFFTIIDFKDIPILKPHSPTPTNFPTGIGAKFWNIFCFWKGDKNVNLSYPQKSINIFIFLLLL